MRCIIAGSRDATEDQVLRAIDECPWSDKIVTVVSGGARGADTYGERWAERRGLAVVRYLPEYKRYAPKIAPIMRNVVMSQHAEALIAVWDGVSPGTGNMIGNARKLDLRVFVWNTRTQSSSE